MVDLDSRGDERRGCLEHLRQAAVTVVEVNRHDVAVAQDLANEIGARPARSVPPASAGGRRLTGASA